MEISPLPPSFSEQLYTFFNSMLKDIPKEKQESWKNEFKNFVDDNMLDVSQHPSQELIEDLENTNLTENSLQQKVEAYKKKKENILKYLRENRINGKLNVSYGDFTFDETPTGQSKCKEMLKLIDKQMLESDRRCVRFAHYSGKMINHQKNVLKKENFKLFKKEIGYSDGWISFFTLCL